MDVPVLPQEAVPPAPIVTVTLCVADVPLDPVQLPENVALEVSAPEDTEPDVPVCHELPFSKIVQAVAFDDVHEIFDEAPEETEIGEAERERVGPDPPVPMVLPETVTV